MKVKGIKNLIVKNITSIFRNTENIVKLLLILLCLFMMLYKLFPNARFGSIKDRFVSSESSESGTIHYFSMKGCPHCIEFSPIFETFEDNYEGSITVLKTTVSDTVKPPPEYKVVGYPAVVFVSPDGEITHFEGPRTVENLEVFARDVTP